MNVIRISKSGSIDESDLSSYTCLLPLSVYASTHTNTIGTCTEE